MQKASEILKRYKNEGTDLGGKTRPVVYLGLAYGKISVWRRGLSATVG